MKKLIFSLAVVVFSTALMAADTNSTPAEAGAKYTAAIEGRTGDILKLLALDDTAKVGKVHDIIIAQYRVLNAWHADNDAKLKSAKADTNAVANIRASLKTLHDAFLSQLGENLTPEQVDKVKDKMTYGKVQFTFAGYISQYPNLSEENKIAILNLLKEAREQAMDGGSSEEKTAIFQRYKGKINNYLSKQGIHPEKQKSGATAAVTNSVPDKQ